MPESDIQRDRAWLKHHSVLANLLVNALLALSGAALALVLLEIVALFALPAPVAEKWPPSMTEPDPRLGWRMVPNDEHYTYTFAVHVNSHGLRNRAIGARPAREFRVLTLGDSHVYGQGLPDEHVFTTQLAQRLDATGSRGRFDTFNVINAGIRAYSTTQEIAFLRTTGLELQPNLVLLCVYINDLEVVDVAHAYEVAWQINHGGSYRFDLKRPDGPTTRAIWETAQLARRARILMYGNDLINALRTRNGYEARLLHGAVDDDIRSRFAAVTVLFRELRSVLAENQIPGLVVIIPAASQLLPQFGSSQYQRLTADAARSAELEVVDLLPAFRSKFRNPDALPILPFDGHFDATAHGLIADTLYPVVLGVVAALSAG